MYVKSNGIEQAGYFIYRAGELFYFGFYGAASDNGLQTLIKIHTFSNFFEMYVFFCDMCCRQDGNANE